VPAPKTILKYSAATLSVALLLVYVTDWAVVRVRAIHPAAASPFETITVARVLAIPEKNGKTEYQIDELQPEETITCVHSLFPHSGFNPCWYVKPRAMRPIPM
jgi:hypothetical protein